MSGTLQTGGGYQGLAWLQTGGSLGNALDFVMRMILAGDAQAEIVLVLAVHGGGVGSPPTVDVQPMVNQQNVAGTQMPHGTVYGLPCLRMQGGVAALIIDPVAGDIGLAVYCDRDISTVKNTKAVSPPGSWRQRSRSDGVYVGSLLCPTPTNYLQVTQTGINVVTAGNLTISALNCTLDASGNLAVTGEVTGRSGGGSSVTLTGHEHVQANDSHGDTEAPTAAPTPGT